MKTGPTELELIMVVRAGAGVEPVNEVSNLTLNLNQRFHAPLALANAPWEQLHPEMHHAVHRAEHSGKSKPT